MFPFIEPDYFFGKVIGVARIGTNTFLFTLALGAPAITTCIIVFLLEFVQCHSMVLEQTIFKVFKCCFSVAIGHFLKYQVIKDGGLMECVKNQCLCVYYVDQRVT